MGIGKVQMNKGDGRNLESLVEVGIFLEDGYLNEFDVGMMLGECSHSRDDRSAGEAPRTVPQSDHQWVILVQGGFEFLHGADVLNERW